MIVYVIVGGGGVNSVWTTPEAAIDANERTVKDGSYIAVRPTNADEPTEESKTALLALRELERDRHNRRAREIQEARNLRRTQAL